MSNKILSNIRLIQKCIIVNREGKILAIKRAADDHSRGGNWDLPGGGYEQGEMVISAIKREIMEEVGLTVEHLAPVYFTNKIGVKEGFFQGENVFGVCYVSSDWEGLPAEATGSRNGRIGSMRDSVVAQEGEIVLSDEHTEYQWFSPQDFIKLNFGADSGFFVASIKAYIT